MPEDEPKDPVLEALWQRVLEAWGDDKTHAAIIEHAVHEQLLPEIAGRYRALTDDADKGPVARKKLDAIVVAATQMLMATKTPGPVKVPVQITLSAVGVCAVMLAWLAWALWGPR